jgi:metal-responsive CopG/Arc/MetJ family transcriptional regulator
MNNEKTGKSRERNKNNTETHTQLSIRLPNELLEHIEAFAIADRRNRSNAIEYLLWQAVKENQECGAYLPG